MTRKHQSTEISEKILGQEEEGSNSHGDSSSESSTRPTKKAKKEEQTPIPTNTKMPESFSFEKREGTIKFASWNVSGLKSALKKGFKTYVEAEDADILCLQETKVNTELEGVVDHQKYKYRWWGFEEKKGYAGTVVFSKINPISVSFGLSTHPDPKVTEGRVITLEFETLYYVACYVPNAGEKLVRLKEKIIWDEAMEKYLKQLDEKKPVIWAGDLNVAHKPIDLARPETNKKTPGFTPEERRDFDRILNEGKNKFVDTWRHFHPNTLRHYTYFSYRFQCRSKIIGWRLDYHVVSERILNRVVESEIRLHAYGASDHVPIVLVIKDDL
ncbi:7004_t:CDS:2 [Funneliformis caledonium]|uniref:7004_t:CDS:1 n=2 Tax=Funneliformis TaxID=1117308 RepID=A0A9N8W6U3_9GLOM|nr:7004_t:CDS:2 [Funneliformis caledonium]CAG8478355.1 8401_t:CDS:2 [Funneliformis mosseae]